MILGRAIWEMFQVRVATYPGVPLMVLGMADRQGALYKEGTGVCLHWFWVWGRGAFTGAYSITEQSNKCPYHQGQRTAVCKLICISQVMLAWCNIKINLTYVSSCTSMYGYIKWSPGGKLAAWTNYLSLAFSWHNIHCQIPMRTVSLAGSGTSGSARIPETEEKYKCIWMGKYYQSRKFGGKKIWWV